MDYEESLDLVVKIAEKTGRSLLRIQPEVVEIEKEGKDFLTTADLKADSIICKGLKRIAPDIPIYSEEGEERLENIQEPRFIEDPLDGTINFYHQDVFWGISIALVENQEIQLGVIYLPALKQLIGVTRSAGRKGRLIQKGKISFGVRKDNDITKAQIWTDWAKKPGITVPMFSKIAKHSFRPQVRMSCSAALLWVASGRISGFVHGSIGPEDGAAGSLIVEEAGGRVTDLDGNPWTPFSESIVASNGILHDQILEALK